MYQKINENELPSTQKLIISTVIALFTALVILVTVVLPAEYGIDKTGVGQLLGLTEMGEIKQQLAQEANEEQSSIAETTAEAKTSVTTEVRTTELVGAAKSEEQPKLNRQQMQLTLKPGQAAEIKVALNKGESVTYVWRVNAGHLNFDVHGDNATTSYFNYKKGKAFTSDQDQLVAAFDGKHGWFWRNRSDRQVMLILEVEGQFDQLIRVL